MTVFFHFSSISILTRTNVLNFLKMLLWNSLHYKDKSCFLLNIIGNVDIRYNNFRTSSSINELMQIVQHYKLQNQLAFLNKRRIIFTHYESFILNVNMNFFDISASNRHQSVCYDTNALSVVCKSNWSHLWKQQMLNYFTYKAVRTVLHQLYEMNPPKYTWFYK